MAEASKLQPLLNFMKEMNKHEQKLAQSGELSTKELQLSKKFQAGLTVFITEEMKDIAKKTLGKDTDLDTPLSKEELELVDKELESLDRIENIYTKFTQSIIDEFKNNAEDMDKLFMKIMESGDEYANTVYDVSADPKVKAEGEQKMNEISAGAPVEQIVEHQEVKEQTGLAGFWKSLIVEFKQGVQQGIAAATAAQQQNAQAPKPAKASHAFSLFNVFSGSPTLAAPATVGGGTPAPAGPATAPAAGPLAPPPAKGGKQSNVPVTVQAKGTGKWEVQVINKLTGIEKAIADSAKRIEEGLKKYGTAGAGTKGIFSKMISSITGLIMKPFNMLTSGFSKMKNAITAPFAKIGNMFSGFMDKLKGGFKTLLFGKPMTEETFWKKSLAHQKKMDVYISKTEAWQKSVLAALNKSNGNTNTNAPAALTMGQKATNMFGNLKDMFADAISDGLIKTVMKGLLVLGGLILAFMAGLKIGEWINENVIAPAQIWFGELLDSIGQFFDDVSTFIQEGIVNPIKQGFESLGDKINEWIINPFKKFYNWIADSKIGKLMGLETKELGAEDDGKKIGELRDKKDITPKEAKFLMDKGIELTEAQKDSVIQSGAKAKTAPVSSTTAPIPSPAIPEHIAQRTAEIEKGKQQQLAQTVGAASGSAVNATNVNQNTINNTTMALRMNVRNNDSPLAMFRQTRMRPSFV
jgi:hypothetical protein